MWQVAVVLIFVGIAAIFAALAIKLNDEHTALKLLFFLLTFGILVAGIHVTMQMVQTDYPEIYNTLSYIYKPMIYVLVFVIFYFIVYFIYKTAISIKISKTKRWQS